MSNRHACLTGWHILQDDVSYRKTRLTGGHVLMVCMYNRKPLSLKGITGRHVLQEYIYYERGLVLLKVMF